MKSITIYLFILLTCGLSFGQKRGKYQDVEGNSFRAVEIGALTWSNKNLETTKFKNGDPIPQAKTREEWLIAAAYRKPAWCYVNYDPNNGLKYGKLYNWYAVFDRRGLAPEGWRIPTEDDFESLKKVVDSYNKTNPGATKYHGGCLLKSSSGWYKEPNSHWGTSGDDVFGFKALPGMYLTSDGYITESRLKDWHSGQSQGAYFWSYTENGIKDAVGVEIVNNSTQICRSSIDIRYYPKTSGRSVRLVKE